MEIIYEPVEMTEADKTSYAAIAAELEAQEQYELSAIAAKEAALAKLKKLGLTADEAKAVIGMN